MAIKKKRIVFEEVTAMNQMTSPITSTVITINNYSSNKNNDQCIYELIYYHRLVVNYIDIKLWGKISYHVFKIHLRL